MWFILLSLDSPWGFCLLPHVPFATASMPAETFICLLYQDPTTFLPHCYLLPCCKSFPSECLSTAQCLQITLDTACGRERTQAPPRGKTGWKMSHPLRSPTCAGSSDRSGGWLSSYFSGVVMAMREEDKLNLFFKRVIWQNWVTVSVGQREKLRMTRVSGLGKWVAHHFSNELLQLLPN